MIRNHWGVYVDSEVPVTGVFNISEPEWFGDELSRAEDPQYYEHLKECKNEYHDDCYFKGNCEGYLIGFIRDEKTGLWDINPSAEYSVILGETYGQVVHSKWVSRCALCSPCYPGQGDLSTPGEFLAYTLPAEVWGDAKHLTVIERSLIP